MRSFPLPVRVAAGLAVTAVEQTRRLPSVLIGLPVTLASEALQVSMRLQQQLTELAIKGDEALAGLQSLEEQPAWATFDEDETAPSTEEARPQVDIAAVPADYDVLTLPQLRGKLRGFTETELVELLEYERTHAQRPEFLRMLGRRLDRLRAE